MEKGTNEIEVVTFENGQFTGKIYATRPIFKFWEVIGNIYENKGVLK